MLPKFASCFATPGSRLFKEIYLSASLMDSKVTGVTGSPHLLWMSAGNQALDLANIVSIQTCERCLEADIYL